MSENLAIIQNRLTRLDRIRADLAYATQKLAEPLEKITQGLQKPLGPDERLVVSAFNKLFCDYMEQLGGLARCIAIEEESPTNPFGSILALMEKLGILDDSQHWKTVRELRNRASHEYEDNPDELSRVLTALHDSTSYLIEINERMRDFVSRNYVPSLGQ